MGHYDSSYTVRVAEIVFEEDHLKCFSLSCITLNEVYEKKATIEDGEEQ